MVPVANFVEVDHVVLGRTVVVVLAHKRTQGDQMVLGVNYGDILEDSWVDNAVDEVDVPSV